MRSPQKLPMRSPQTEPTRSLEMDPMRSPQTGARVRAPRPPPVELDAEGQALRKRLRTFRTQAVRKNYKASTHLPATLPLSPRVLKCPFSLPALNAQLTSSRVLVAVFGVCGNGDCGVCYVRQHEEISTRAPRFCVAYQASHAVAADRTHAVAGDGTHAVAAEASHAVAADGIHTVAGDGSHAVATDRRARACAAAAAHRARRRGPGPPRTAPRVPRAGGENKLQSFNAPSRDSPTLF